MASLDNGDILRPSRIKNLPEGHLALMANKIDLHEAGEPVTVNPHVDIRAQEPTQQLN